jgi:replication factor A1
MKCTFKKSFMLNQEIKSGCVVKLTDVVFSNDLAEVREFSFVDASESPEFKTPHGGNKEKTVPGQQQKDIVNSRRSQPIASLNPYQPAWTIKAKLVVKGQTRTYRNAKGEGKVLTIELVDSEGTAIQATLWREAVEKYENVLEVGKLYYISKGSLRPANRAYSTVNNDYEMSLDGKSEIFEASEEEQMESSAKKIFEKAFEFVQIGDLVKRVNSKRATCDVCAVVKQVGDLSAVKRKSDNSEIQKRDLTLCDESSNTVHLTLWNTLAIEQGEKLKQMTNAVIIVRAVRVTEYEGVSLGTLGKSEMQIFSLEECANAQSSDGEIPEKAIKTAKWFSENGEGTVFKTAAEGAGLSIQQKGTARAPLEHVTLCDFQPDEVPSASEKPKMCIIQRASVLSIRDGTMWYCAAPEEGNNAKVVEENGAWYCEKNQKTYATCKRRYIMGAKIADKSGHCWLTLFNDDGEKLFGHTADEMFDFSENDNDRFERIKKEALFKAFTFKLKSKSEEYDGQTRRKVLTMHVCEIDFASECRSLLSKMGVEQ